MRLSLTTLFIAVLMVTSFAGCLGGSDTDLLDGSIDGSKAAPTEDTGSVEGRVVTDQLMEVEGAAVAAVAADGSIAETAQTDKEGRYVINGLEPGDYRIQVSALCCRPAVKAVTVVEKQTAKVDLQLPLLTASDLQTPSHTHEEWTGFISCGIGSLVISWAACSTLDDPNDDFHRLFTVKEGLKTLIIGATWTPVGGVSGTELWVAVEDPSCGLECPADVEYAEVQAPPNIVIRLDDGPSSKLSFDSIDDERTIQMRIFPGGDANVMYQQPFTIHWHAFYWEEAPQDFDPFPDA